MIKRRGLMFVLSSPSGAGKTTLARRLLDTEPNLEMSVSVTTRPMRPGEVDGRDYYFLKADEFNLLAESGELLEHAQVFGNFYGTPRGPVAAALEQGRDVLFDIDWQGTQQLEQAVREDLVRVFILPPSLKELERRLRERAQDPHEVVNGRMARAWDEISHWAEYDYVIVNDDLERTLEGLRAILTAERLRRTRQKGLAKFVNGLRGQKSGMRDR
ncbi:MAG: guanylate kinase [Alphaproteobacteria bacterium]